MLKIDRGHLRKIGDKIALSARWTTLPEDVSMARGIPGLDQGEALKSPATDESISTRSIAGAWSLGK
jgi:hypothetical protein